MGFVVGDGAEPHGVDLLDPEAKDRFGLPLSYSLLSENAEDREARISAATQLISDAFKAAVRHLGYEEARHRFEEVCKKPHHGKQPDRKVNDALLSIYDREALHAQDKGVLPRQIAEALHQNRRGEFGLSATSIEKRLRRAIENRKEERRLEEERIRAYQAVVAMRARGTFRK